MDEPINSYHLATHGVPDRLIVLPGGKIGFAELKRPKTGKTRTLQERQILFLMKLGCIVEVVASIEDIDKVILKIDKEGAI